MSLERPDHSDSELHALFGYHAATPETIGVFNATRAHFEWLATWVKENTKVSREQSLALTALQEAAMWTNASTACNGAPTAHAKL